jgi:hypothetical protein
MDTSRGPRVINCSWYGTEKEEQPVPADTVPVMSRLVCTVYPQYRKTTQEKRLGIKSVTKFYLLGIYAVVIITLLHGGHFLDKHIIGLSEPTFLTRRT